MNSSSENEKYINFINAVRSVDIDNVEKLLKTTDVKTNNSEALRFALLQSHEKLIDILWEKSDCDKAMDLLGDFSFCYGVSYLKRKHLNPQVKNTKQRRKIC